MSKENLALYNNGLLDEVNFLQICRAYGAANQETEKKVCIWHECISEERKKKNENIVMKMLDYAKEYNDNLTIYYNGLKVSLDTGESITENTDEIPFGNPPLLPVFLAPVHVAYCYDQVLEKMGYYVECWNYGQYQIGAMANSLSFKEIEIFEEHTKELKEKFIGAFSSDAPKILIDIGKTWKELSRLTGDGGRCVIGEGMKFVFNGQKYKLSPCSPFQGDASWRFHVHYIEMCLAAIGASDISMSYGRLD